MAARKDIEQELEYSKSYPNGVPYVSIVMATYNKAEKLDRTLESIRLNHTDVPYEIIVVDDGSSDDTINVCKKHSCIYIWVNAPVYRGPAVPRNIGCRAARGQILIMQSDDVIHSTTDTINKLIDLPRGTVNIASAWNVDANLNKKNQRPYVHGEIHPVPLFFLGSMYKDDFWAIGGNDEDFTAPGYEDTFLGELIRRKYFINWRNDIEGFHQDHKRHRNLGKLAQPSKLLFEHKMKHIDEILERLGQ